VRRIHGSVTNGAHDARERGLIIPVRRAYSNRPPASMTGWISPSGSSSKRCPLLRFRMLRVSKSITASSPVLKCSTNLVFDTHGYSSPVDEQLRKKIRAYEVATTALAPAAPRAIGACSLELPQPKFSPAIMMLYFVDNCPSSTKRSG